MTERLAVLEYSRETIIMELGLIAVVGHDPLFEEAYEEKLEELREITNGIIQVKEPTK